MGKIGKICGLVAAMLLPACMNEVEDLQSEDTVEVEIGTQSIDLGTGTKSSYLSSDAAADVVNNFSLFIFDGSKLVEEAYSPAGTGVSVALASGTTYSIHILANMGDLRSSIGSMGELNAYTHAVSMSGIQNNGLPMYGGQNVQVTGASVVIPVTRLVARYEFRLDKSAITGGTLSLQSLTVRNIADTFSPASAFKASAAQIASTGDYSSASDVSALNSGSGVYFYVPENMQGTESGLTKAAMKLPKSEEGAYSYSTVDTDLCSYIEARCNYNDGSDHGVTYRVMLGENSTSSFNIVRNTKYIVTLKPSGNPLSSSWWKCEPDVTDKTLTSLKITPASQSVEAGRTITFTATAYWSDGTSTVVTTDPGTNWAVISGSAHVSASPSKGEFIGKAAGPATIQASYGGKNATASLTVYSSAPVISYSLSVTAGAYGTARNATITQGGSRQFHAYLITSNNGVESHTEVTDAAIWSSGNTDVATVSKGSASGVGVGNTLIYAQYTAPNGYILKDNGSLTVESPSVDVTVSHRLVVSPESQNVSVGNSASYAATYYTTTNGVEDEGVDVTAVADWRVISGNSHAHATSTAGEFMGDLGGTATIQASYEGEEDTAILNVSDVISYRLAVSPGNAEVKVGNDVDFTAILYKTTNGIEDSGRIVTDECSWSEKTGGYYAMPLSAKGRFRAVRVGSTEVYATSAGIQAKAALTITAAPEPDKPDDVITHEIVISPGAESISVGEFACFTATYYTLTNGVRDGGQNVTAYADWTVRSSSPGYAVAATSTKGQFRGDAAGTATIQASYNGVAATAVITVKQPPVYLKWVQVVYTVYDLVDGNQSAPSMTVDSGQVNVPQAAGNHDLGNIASHLISIYGTDGCSFKITYTISYGLSIGTTGTYQTETGATGGLEWYEDSGYTATISNPAWVNSASITFGPHN